MIYRVILYELTCDTCGDPALHEPDGDVVRFFDEEEDAIAYAKQHGWRIMNHFGWVEHTCPRCLGDE